MFIDAFFKRILPVFRRGRDRPPFVQNKSGSTALMFAVSIVPLMIFAGGTIDYARTLRSSTKLKAATDSAALAGVIVTSDPANAANTNILQIRLAAARAAFNANIASDDSLTGVSMTLVEVPNGVQVSAQGVSANYFGGLIGNPASNLAAFAEAGLSPASSNMEIAFVLDNTGSMAQNNKMPLLKAAMQKFMNKLQASLKPTNVVKAALVPFDTQVRLDPIFATGTAWIRQTPAQLAGWNGCVSDRLQPYDANATTPSIIIPDTLFDAVTSTPLPPLNASPASCGLPQMMPLTTNLAAFSSAVNAMSPNGSTNGTIGLVWGLQMLTPGEPYNAASAFGGGPRKVMVFLTDGANTQSRFTNVAADIDARMSLVCTEIKSKGIDLYTIGLMDANMAILRPCASSPDMSYQVTNPTGIPDLFDLISQQFVQARLTR